MTSVQAFRLKPAAFLAIRYQPGRGCNCRDVLDFVGGDESWLLCQTPQDDGCDGIEWHLDPGFAEPGDWIVAGLFGGYQAVKPDDFAARFVPAAGRT